MNPKIAAAPITWGVCEAEGWGVQLPVDRVLSDMASLGVSATEFGPLGFLPEKPEDRAEHLDRFGLRAVGGFLPVVLHREDIDPTPLIAAELEAFRAAGADVLVLAADSGTGNYEDHYELTESEWPVFRRRLTAAVEQARQAGIRAVLHPHVGTMIESASAVERLLAETDVEICLDTGHLLVGGTIPLELVRQAASRIGHVHLKDVNMDLARRVSSGEVGFVEGVKSGMFVPLGQGDSQIEEVVRLLESAGYTGWYVMEQDAYLLDDHAGDRAFSDARQSIEFLTRALA